MRIASSMFTTQFEISDGEIFSLVMENPRLFRSLLEDIYRQADGDDGITVFSENNVPLSLAKASDILDAFTPFNPNTKTMLSGIAAMLDKTANDEAHCMMTNTLLADIENYVNELCFDMPFRAECGGLSAQALIKSLKISVADDCETLAESLIQYMTIISSFGKCKIFICVNMLGILDTDELAAFADEVRKKQLRVLLIDAYAPENVSGVRRLTIDKDLCEF